MQTCLAKARIIVWLAVDILSTQWCLRSMRGANLTSEGVNGFEYICNTGLAKTHDQYPIMPAWVQTMTQGCTLNLRAFLCFEDSRDHASCLLWCLFSAISRFG